MDSLSEKIYSRSPIWAQQLFVALYGWWWWRRRFGKSFHEFVSQLEARERWTGEKFQKYQEERLLALFNAAWDSPYYRQVFAEAGITKGMPPFDRLSRMPLLTKETLRSVKAIGPRGIEVSGAQVLRCPLTPWALLSAQTWLLRRRAVAWWACWRDVLFSIRKVSRLHHLIYILMVTSWLDRYLHNIKVDHIRGHFLHSEAISSMWLSRMLGKPYSLTAHVVSSKHTFSS